MTELGAAAALSAEDRAGLVNALKNKLQSLAGQHSDELESPSPSVMKRVEVLRELQVYGGDDSDAESPSQNHSSSANQKLPLDSHKSSSDSNNEQGVLKKGGGNSNSIAEMHIPSIIPTSECHRLMNLSSVDTGVSLPVDVP